MSDNDIDEMDDGPCTCAKNGCTEYACNKCYWEYQD